MEDNQNYQEEAIEFAGPLSENEEETEMENNNMNTEEIEAVEGFAARNKDTIIAATGTGIAGLLGGYGLGTWKERKKTEKILKGIETELKLFNAAELGEVTIEIDGKELATANHKITDVPALKEHIAKEFLTNEKISDSQKERFRNIFIGLARLTSLAVEKEIVNDKKIVEEDNE